MWFGDFQLFDLYVLGTLQHFKEWQFVKRIEITGWLARISLSAPITDYLTTDYLPNTP
jgi:hypothetical protein